MAGMLIAYDAAGNVVGTLDALVRHDGDNYYLEDFETIETSGRPLDLRDGGVWTPPSAVGSGHWPEWLGAAAHDFRVELGEGPHRIRALIGKVNGTRRERAAIEERITQRRAETPAGQPVDLRSIVGGPNRPLLKADQPR